MSRVFDNGTSQPEMELEVPFFISGEGLRKAVKKKFGKSYDVVDLDVDSKKLTIVRRLDMKTNFFSFSSIAWMALCIMLEAGGEPYKGKIAVGYVILNRYRAQRSYFGHTIVGVILKRKQFSCFNNVEREKLVKDFEKGCYRKDMDECFKAARAAFYGEEKDPTNGAFWYVHKRLEGKCRWMKNLVVTARIGNHVFYGEKRG